MSKVLVLGAAALAFSAASASAQDYGYEEPAADLAAPADGYAAPAAPPVYTAPPVYGVPLYTAPPVYAAPRSIHHQRSMRLRSIHLRQSTRCRLLSTQLQWERPWFRDQYMLMRPGIGVATGMDGAATATGMGGAKHRRCPA